VKDTGGHVSSVTQPVTVIGPAPPAPANTSSVAGAPGSGGGGGTAKVHHNPVATAAIVSRSLRRALHKGLVVRYSINEALAGHLEVLLPTSLARRLHVSGASATGLPAGTAPQTIIAKSLLVAARGGTGTLTLHVSSKTVARMLRLHKASLLLRLVLHNNSGGSVVVIASASLSG
jgi:hypothetical protein